jgi:hypothetical protein
VPAHHHYHDDHDQYTRSSNNNNNGNNGNNNNNRIIHRVNGKSPGVFLKKISSFFINIFVLQLLPTTTKSTTPITTTTTPTTMYIHDTTMCSTPSHTTLLPAGFQRVA